MNITITGNLGAGKTTVRDELKKLGYDTLSGGDVFRRVAEQKGVSVVELNEMLKGDPAIDDEIDGMTARLGREVDNTVFDFRLGWHFVPDSFKVFLLIDPEVAAERVFYGEARNAEVYKSLEDTKEALKRRAESERERFADLYGINYYDAKNYDLVIESSYASPEQITGEIVRCLQLYEAGDKRKRIELGLFGLYPTKALEELDGEGIKTICRWEQESASLCVGSAALVTVQDGYCRLLEGHHSVLAGAAAGKQFAQVHFTSPEALKPQTALLSREELEKFEKLGNFTYRGNPAEPKQGFLLEF
ncbi:MAG: cytidylate kinase family protein [Blautia sp.]|nr:cytidylate kinase family protein [Blautia sp.]